jgi:hypothetical protein
MTRKLAVIEARRKIESLLQRRLIAKNKLSYQEDRTYDALLYTNGIYAICMTAILLPFMGVNFLESKVGVELQVAMIVYTVLLWVFICHEKQVVMYVEKAIAHLSHTKDTA